MKIDVMCYLAVSKRRVGSKTSCRFMGTHMKCKNMYCGIYWVYDIVKLLITPSSEQHFNHNTLGYFCMHNNAITSCPMESNLRCFVETF